MIGTKEHMVEDISGASPFPAKGTLSTRNDRSNNNLIALLEVLDLRPNFLYNADTLVTQRSADFNRRHVTVDNV